MAIPRFKAPIVGQHTLTWYVTSCSLTSAVGHYDYLPCVCSHFDPVLDIGIEVRFIFMMLGFGGFGVSLPDIVLVADFPSRVRSALMKSMVTSRNNNQSLVES